MKILIPTPTHPSINSSLIIIFKNILKNLEKKVDLECSWFLYTTKKFDSLQTDNETIININNFKNAVDVLKNIKPDCVLADNNKHYAIDYAFSIASKSLKIPLIYYKSVDLAEEEPTRSFSQIKDNFKRNLIQFFSTDYQTKGQKRSSFIIYKNKFLFETKRALGSGLIENLKSQLGNLVFHFIGESKKRFSDLADLQLVSNEIWMNMLQKAGIDRTKLVLTGNPYWDELYNVIKKINLSKDPIVHKPLRLLILTTPMIEHGHWTIQQRENFLRNLITTLNRDKEFSFSFKIHPSTENLDEYTSLIKKLGFKTKIFQKESFWNIAKNFDIIISYGYTTMHSECATVGYRMILFEGKHRQMPLVDTAIKSGFIKKCHVFNELSATIRELAQVKIQFNEKHLQEIEKIFYKFDGNSGERAADAILKLMKSKGLKS